MRSSVIVSMLVLSYIPLVDSGWFSNILDKVCPIACPRVCTFFDGPVTSVVCKIVCNLGCGGRGKRHIAQVTTGHIIPLSNRFDAFDLNDDGYISKKEMCVAISDDESNPDFNKAFDLADTNGDNRLTPTELYGGPYVFEMDLDDNDRLYCQSLLNINSTHTG